MKPTDLKPTTRFWLFLIGIVVLVFTVILASFEASWMALNQEEHELIIKVIPKLIPFPMLGALILVLIIGSLVSLLFHYYITPILQLAEQTRLISSVNPEFRVEPKGAKEVLYLAKMINESADVTQALRTEVEARIRQAKAEVNAERTRLAALMSELPHGVLVCNTDGQLLLYNQQAQKMLNEKNGDGQPGKLIGLGRSIFSLVDREPIIHALEFLQRAVGKGQAAPVSTFMISLHNQSCLRVKMAPVSQQQDGVRIISGFVLTLTDMTVQMEQEALRDSWIQDLTNGLQGSLEEIRTAISTILGTPDLPPTQLRENRLAIDRASQRIGDRLRQSRGEYARLFHSTISREKVSGRDLLEVIAKQLKEKHRIRIETQAAEDLWIDLDSHALAIGIMQLVGAHQSERPLRNLSLHLTSSGEQHASLVLQSHDPPLIENVVQLWSTAPMFSDDRQQPIDLHELLARWGGNLSMKDADGQSRLELKFPAQLGKGHLEIEQTLEHRPVYYDFGLFNQAEWGELAHQPLRKLTFVVFDTETTGLQPSQGDEIIQIGGIRIVNNRLLYDETFDQLVDPKRHIPSESVAIHGITPSMVKGQPTIDKVLPNFHHFAEGSVLVAHNAAFDMKFLRMKEAETGVSFDHPVIDTLLLSSIVHPHQESHNLEEIADRLNVTIVGRHTALGDAIVTAEVLLKLIPLLESQGIQSLDEALSASAWSRYAKIKF